MCGTGQINMDEEYSIWTCTYFPFTKIMFMDEND